MVKNQIEARGVRSPLVLNAMRTVPRHCFVEESMQEFAYEDTPLPIAAEQTISQPYIVALMIESLSLTGGEQVLEIGAGSGYAVAVLGQIAGKVYSIERIEELAITAAATLEKLNYQNIEVICADGTKGLPEHSPFDAISVAASGPEIPEALKLQLKIGGRLVIPVGPQRATQTLVRITRLSEILFRRESIAEVRFVPLIGEQSWSSQ